jgi:micrococcal nuclease
VYGKQVQLERASTDRYGRTLGRLTLEGADINFEMVRRGFAWCYRKYLTDESCLGIEEQAKRSRRGLWADASPVPPWEFRHPEPAAPTR